MKRVQYSILMVAFLLVLILNAFNTTPVFADETNPPVDEVPSKVDPLSEEGEDKTEATSTQEEVVLADAVGISGTVQEGEFSSVTEIVELLPEGAEIVITNEEGEVLPLASTEAQEVIITGDPMWCPVGVTPNLTGAGGCTLPDTSFAGMLSKLTTLYGADGPAKAGVIWIEGSYDSSVNDSGATSFILDGGLLTDMDGFALTINGGWTGTGTALDVNNPSEFNIPFIIINWSAPVTINNLLVTGAGGGTYALQVWTTSNITVNNADVHTNTSTFGGATLDNYSTSGTGNVVVNDSTFTNNNGVGLGIQSRGTITLKNVIANANGSLGALIHNHNAITPKVVTLNGTNHFSYNNHTGLSIVSKGIITLNNITAIENIYFGTLVDNCSYNTGTGLCNYGVANGVTIKGTNNFNNNGYDGLRVWSGGVITVNNITADGNGTNQSAGSGAPNNYNATGKGVFLFNYGATTAKNIVLSGTNTFTNNASAGIFANSKGLITVNNLTANQNGCNLTYEINDDYCAGAYFSANNGFTQTGYGRFVGNNDSTGLLVQGFSKGAVTLNNLYADRNHNGVEVNGTSLTGINVTINGVSTFVDNNVDGLSVITDGAVTINNITASLNIVGVRVENTTLIKPVTINGINTFNYNASTGLSITSYGAITISNVTANSGNTGIYVSNQSSNAVGGVTFKGYSTVTDTDAYGIQVFSAGAITLANVTANNNNSIGLFLDNDYHNLAPANVTITGTNQFNLNGSRGLHVNTYGNVLLNNITASSNGLGGAYIDANGGTLVKTVTLNGNNMFNDNIAGDGLHIDSLGAIKINNIIANANVGASSDGAELYNYFAFENQPITITGYGIFNNNGDRGLLITSNGNITLGNITANNNFHGTQINTENNALLTAAYTASVTLTGINTFNDNNGWGLSVINDGTITISNLTANNNQAFGAYLDNDTFANGAVKPINLTGTSVFNNNDDTGLSIKASGNVSLTRITASLNTDAGLYVSSGGAITLTCGLMYYNADYGYSLSAGVGKVVTIKGVYTYGNGLGNISSPTTAITRACPLP